LKMLFRGDIKCLSIIKGFYRYDYVFWRLKLFFFSEFCQFHPEVSLFK